MPRKAKFKIPAPVFDRRVEIDPEVDEQARRAVHELRKMLPGLTGYARAYTGDPQMTLQIHSGPPMTNGKVIYLRPVMGLGDRRKHDNRAMCEERDERSVPRCPACAAREEVLIHLYHEIAHITEKSFEDLKEADRVELVVRAIRESASKDSSSRANQIAARIEAAEPENYVHAANLVSPYLGKIQNAFEDARVNRGMFAARPGTLPMFKGLTNKIFNEGQTRADGSNFTWAEAPRNAQAVVGLFAKASGYDYRGWFSPDVEEMLNDPEITRLVAQLYTARSAKAVYRMGFPVLEALRARGFCKAQDDPEDEPVSLGECDPDDEDAQESDDSELSDSEGESGDDADTPETEQQEGDPGDSDTDEGQGEPDPDDSDEAHGDGKGDDPNDCSGDEEQEEEDGNGEGQDDSSGDTDESDSDAVAGDESDRPDEQDGSDAGGSTGDSSGSESESGSDDIDSTGDTDNSDYCPDCGLEDWECECDDSDEGDDDGDAQANADNSRAGDDEWSADAEGDEPDPNDGMGTPEECQEALDQFGGHESDGSLLERESTSGGSPDGEEAITRAVVQAEYFDSASTVVFGVNEHRYDRHVILPNGKDLTADTGWAVCDPDDPYMYRRRDVYGLDIPEKAPEQVLGPALQRLRIVFSDNRRGKKERNLRTGRVNTRVLGRRAVLQDDRLFLKKRLPGKKDYYVHIGLDVSSSTIGGSGSRISMIKQSALAMADLLGRLGIPFSVTAHTGGNWSGVAGKNGMANVDIFWIKEPNEIWTDKIRKRLLEITPSEANLDGHTMEFYRKILDRRTETDKIIMYYTDGAMPAWLRQEQLPILQRELRLCQQRQYTVLGVGINTDSPTQHGLETVRIDSIEDVPEVVKFLGKKLGARVRG